MSEGPADLPLGGEELEFTLTDEDRLAGRELNPGAAGKLFRWVLRWYGAPLVPSLLLLLAAQLPWLAAAVAALFLMTAAYGLWKQEPLLPLGDRVVLRARPDYVDVLTPGGRSRRRWDWYDQVRVTPHWLCLDRDGELQLGVPRRVLTELDAAEVADRWRRRMERAAADPRPLPPLEDAAPTAASEPFRYERAELKDLLSGRLQVTPESGGASRSGCLTMLLLLMMFAAAVISILPLTGNRRLLIWCAVSGALWLPWLTWRLLRPWRLAQQLETAEKSRLFDTRVHSIGPEGVIDCTEVKLELYAWEQIARIDEGRDFLFTHTDDNVFLASPKRAVPRWKDFLEEARAYHSASSPEQTDEDDEAAPRPGPAFESGNPYQPPPAE